MTDSPSVYTGQAMGMLQGFATEAFASAETYMNQLNAYVVADSALNARFKLSVEQINKNRLFPLQKPIPELKSHLGVRSAVRVFVLDVGLGRNLVAVLM